MARDAGALTDAHVCAHGESHSAPARLRDPETAAHWPARLVSRLRPELVLCPAAGSAQRTSDRAESRKRLPESGLPVKHPGAVFLAKGPRYAMHAGSLCARFLTCRTVAGRQCVVAVIAPPSHSLYSLFARRNNVGPPRSSSPANTSCSAASDTAGLFPLGRRRALLLRLFVHYGGVAAQCASDHLAEQTRPREILCGGMRVGRTTKRPLHSEQGLIRTNPCAFAV